jgi:SAM-dependent methyltransferase
MTSISSTTDHYDRLIDEIDDPAQPMVTDPFFDTGALREWMAQADGPAFWDAVGDVRGQSVLEVGVGTGRVARKMLEQGCARLVGIDLSAKTIARARANLATWVNVELLHADIADYRQEATFDLAYLVWTIFHIEDKPRALANIVSSLKPDGRLVISLERVDDWLDYGPRKIQQYPITPEALMAMLKAHGCRITPPIPVYDDITEGQPLLTTIISAFR